MFVSLGGGCDVATNLKKLGLRLEPYPFDWLWNLDAGLDYVSKIIATDFKHLSNKDDYIFASHQISPGEKFLIFKNYPKIAHLHSNPYENDDVLEDYKVRINRFRKLISNTNEKATFIYYRNADVAEDNLANSLQSELAYLKREAALFEDMMARIHPQKPFILVSLLAISDDCFDNHSLKEDLRHICAAGRSARVTFEIVPLRDDRHPEKLKAWSGEWCTALKRAKAISMLELVGGKLSKRKIRAKKKIAQLLAPVSV